MRLAQWVLALSALPFLAIGLAFAIAPGEMGPLVSIDVADSTADNDIRAVYGGLQIGVGLFLALCVRRSEWLRPGLALQMMVFAGLLLGRTVSLGAAGPPTTIGFVLSIGEVLGLVAGVIAQDRLRAADARAADAAQR